MGAIIEVSVNYLSQEVIWTVDGKRMSINFRLLKNKDIKWLPCVWIGEKGDAVEIRG